jgi:hypothetical protein
MSSPFADPYKNMTPQRLQELLQRERYEREAARRRLSASIAFYVRVAFERCKNLLRVRSWSYSKHDRGPRDRTIASRETARRNAVT